MGGAARRTVRAAEDPGVEGRLAVEPVRDAEAAAHAQPPRRPGLLLPLLLAPAAAASLVARAPHGLPPSASTGCSAPLPSAWPRATRLYRSASNLPSTPQRPRRDLYQRIPPARHPRARAPERKGAARNGTSCTYASASLAEFAVAELGLGTGESAVGRV